MRHKRLSRLTQINSQLLKNADDNIGRAMEILDQEKSKLQQLHEYYHFYTDSLRDRMNNGTAAEVLRNYLDFIREIEKSIQQQQQTIVIRMKQYQQLLDSRKQMYREHRPVELVNQKMLLQHNRRNQARIDTESEDICISHYNNPFRQE